MPSTRTEFSKKVRLQRFKLAEGRCEKCKTYLLPGRIRYDHDLPCAFGGDNSLDNCRVYCTPCDGEKTYKKDIPDIAKSNRLRYAAAGIRKRTRPILGSKASRWKRKFDGTVVKRP